MNVVKLRWRFPPGSRNIRWRDPALWRVEVDKIHEAYAAYRLLHNGIQMISIEMESDSGPGPQARIVLLLDWHYLATGDEKCQVKLTCPNPEAPDLSDHVEANSAQIGTSVSGDRLTTAHAQADYFPFTDSRKSQIWHNRQY